LILAPDLEFLQENQLTALGGEIDHIGRMLNGLYQSAYQQINKPINSSTHKQTYKLVNKM
jgi:hypothetical protein